MVWLQHSFAGLLKSASEFKTTLLLSRGTKLYKLKWNKTGFKREQVKANDNSYKNSVILDIERQPVTEIQCNFSKFWQIWFLQIQYKVVLTFKSVDETLVCDHSNESYWAVLSCGTVYYAVQGGSNF